MEPVFLITPAITFLGVLTSQFLNRKIQIDSEQTRVREQTKQIEENRKLQISLQRDQHEHEKTITQYASELRKQEDFVKAIYGDQNSRGGVVAPPGEWLRSTFPGEDGPFVLFETHLGEDFEEQDKLPLNPLQFLADEFKKQCQHSTSNIKVAPMREGFNSETKIRSFIIREFPDHPVVIVYGSLTGNYLSFHAVFSGLSADQLVINPNTRKAIQTVCRPDSGLLGRFSRSLFSKISTRRGQLKENENSQLFPNLHAYEDSGFVIDFAVNTSLHALIDHYMAFFPNISYEPQAARMLKDKSERLRQLGLWSDELSTVQDHHLKAFLETREAISKKFGLQKQIEGDREKDWP